MARNEALKSRTHCGRGHEFTFENTVYETNTNGYLFRRCRTCYRERTKRSHKRLTLKRNQVEQVLEALSEGKTLSNITGVYRDGYVSGQKICGWQALNNFMNANPRLGKIIRKQLEANKLAATQAALNAKRFTAAPALIRNNGTDAYEAIISATSTLPSAIRGDVQGEMFLAIAEGRLSLADIPKRIREFVQQMNRADRQSVFNPWGHLSLEKPVSEDGSLKLIDVIREDQRLW